jgi:hypothetical protein
LTAKPFGLSFLSQLKDRFFNGFSGPVRIRRLKERIEMSGTELLWLEEAGTNEGSA